MQDRVCNPPPGERAQIYADHGECGCDEHQAERMEDVHAIAHFTDAPQRWMSKHGTQRAPRKQGGTLLPRVGYLRSATPGREVTASPVGDEPVDDWVTPVATLDRSPNVASWFSVPRYATNWKS